MVRPLTISFVDPASQMQALEGELGSGGNLALGQPRRRNPDGSSTLTEPRHGTQLGQQVRRGNQITGLHDAALGEDLREAGQVQAR